jgi:hypothetical protein
MFWYLVLVKALVLFPSGFSLKYINLLATTTKYIVFFFGVWFIITHMLYFER